MYNEFIYTRNVVGFCSAKPFSCATKAGVVNKTGMGKITKKNLKSGEENAIRAAIAAVEYLL
ncbi:MAG: hypothetical protein AABY38_08785 [Planctomycetota bacterium]